MARLVEDRCVGCTSIGLPCIGSSCPNRRVEILVCDECGEDCATLYKYDNFEYCESCLIDALKFDGVIKEVL